MANNGQLGTVYEASGKLYLRYKGLDGLKRSVLLCPAEGEGKLDKAGLEKRKLEVLKAAGLTGEMPEEMRQGIVFKDAGNNWLTQCMTRKRNPISSATAKGYSSYLAKLDGLIGDVPLAQVTNKTAKTVVEKLSAESLSAKTITEIISVLKYVVASVLDENGGQIYPRQWNHDFMDLPVIGKQNQPTFTPEQVGKIISVAQGHYAVLYALLAGTGMRIGEALAIELGPQSDNATTISKDCQTIFVRKSVFGQTKQAPKTSAAIREIDVDPELGAYIKSYIGDRKEGWLFSSDSGKPLLQRNILRDSLHLIEVGREALQSFRTVNGKKVKHILFPAVPGVTGKKIRISRIPQIQSNAFTRRGRARGFRAVLARPQRENHH